MQSFSISWFFNDESSRRKVSESEAENLVSEGCMSVECVRQDLQSASIDAMSLIALSESSSSVILSRQDFCKAKIDAEALLSKAQ